MNQEHDPSDPPGAVSNQNQEEGESGLRDDGTHPEPRKGGATEDRDRSRGSDDETAGGASEGSQSTGHPDSAG